MNDRRKRTPLLQWTIVSRCALALLFFSGITFSTVRLLFTEGYNPKLVSPWRPSPSEVISGEFPVARVISVGETVLFPDEVMVLLKYPPSTPLLTKEDIACVYYSRNTSRRHRKTSPLSVGGEYLGHQIVRCDVPPRGAIASVTLKAHRDLPPGPTHEWRRVAYEALIDYDNSTVVFVKGLNLRPGKAANASMFHCVYGWDSTDRNRWLRSEAVSVAQEIVRCKTPLSVLNGPKVNTIKVSVKKISGGILPSVARPVPITQILPDPYKAKPNRMCICTMLRNKARFLREWVMYHSRLGVQRWFIYDNNSNDDITDVISSLLNQNLNINRYIWPWVKTQEAGFAHCALRTRPVCDWVGFIDVDEFLHFPSKASLDSILNDQINKPDVAELRIPCHNFGPSGLTRTPPRGVTVGYTCRLGLSERHKSLVRPEHLNPTLINMVHHFDLADGFRSINVDRTVTVINHYKYQVWGVFKEKFYRRVATYVSDWQQEENVGSRDRVPGLGTRAVEPVDWSTRFCEVNDTGLRDRVLGRFSDPKTGILPWENEGFL